MSSHTAAFALALATVFSGGTLAYADEQMVPLAMSGDWIAMAHRPSMLGTPDVCLVVNAISGVAIRAGVEGVQFRVINKDWALPTGVIGEIQVSVADWRTALKAYDNTDTMVNAELSDDVVIPMLTAMDKSSTMYITVGKSKPLLVSLNGSTRATNAFKTCAHIRGTTKVPGANPFE